MKDRIKTIRKELHLTQQEFADKLKVARNNIAGYETGNRNPSEAVMSLICRTFNVSEKWLRNGEGEMFVQISRENQLMQWAGEVLAEEDSSFRHRIIAALSVLDERDWKDVERVMMKMVGELPAKKQ